MVPLIILIIIILFAFYFFLNLNKSKTTEVENVGIDSSLLNTHVFFYAELKGDEKKQFENDLQYFLEHTRITGVDTAVEPLDKLLVASAAVIPIFYFKQWKYHNLQEVLLYSDAINMDFETKGSADRNILGMVGTGALEGSLLLSKHALRQGFGNVADKHNTAIHEFIHLLDKSDGDTDGIPEILLDKPYVLPWLNLMHEQMQKIANGKSDIDAYGYTNKAEFFAVVSEYFFEQPALLEEKHPKLFKMLKEIFATP